MILLLGSGDFHALFTGDVQGETIEDIVCDVDVLKVPHHGAKDALTEALLEAASPSACVIPVGYNNYGHPSERALDLLALSGTAVYRSDECGMIRCIPHENGSFEITTYLPADINTEAGYDDRSA